MPARGGFPHPIPVRPSEQSPASNLGTPGAVPQASLLSTTTPRRGIVVTVDLSEPANLPELDWAATLASIIRLATQDTSVIVIATWEDTK